MGGAAGLSVAGMTSPTSAADLVSWSLFRKYEGKDSSYADLVSDIVMEESRA